MVLQNSPTTELPSVLADLRAIVLIYHQSVITMSSPLTLTKEIFVPLTRLFRGPLVYFRLTRLIYGAINLSSVIRRKVGSQDFHGLVSNEFNIRRERERGRVRFSYNIGTCIYIALYVRGEGDDQRADKSRDVPGYKSLLSWGKRKKPRSHAASWRGRSEFTSFINFITLPVQNFICMTKWFENLSY